MMLGGVATHEQRERRAGLVSRPTALEATKPSGSDSATALALDIRQTEPVWVAWRTLEYR